MTGVVINKNPLLVTFPPGVLTSIEPEAVFGTMAVIVLSDTTVKFDAGWPPIVTDEALVKFCPVIVIIVPVPPCDGEKTLITGRGMMTNPGIDTFPPSVIKVILTGPYPKGTTA